MHPPDSHRFWSLLSVQVPSAAEEPVTAAFLELTEDVAARATGLVVEENDAGVLTTGPAPPPPGSCRISTYTPAGEAEGVAAALAARLDGLVALGLLAGAPPVTTQAVDVEGLHERWKDFFHVLRVSERIVIRPPWRDYVAEPGDVVIEVEPGMAFGTGGHQTTQLCLRGLEAVGGELAEKAGPGSREVLDVGCGSGVLAIAGLALGATHAVALDVDAAALEATADNARRNGVAGRIEIRDEPLRDLAAAGRRFPLVVANIISGTLLELRDDLFAVAAGGILLVSGLLTDEEAEFRAAFPLPGATLIHREAMDEWLCLGYRVAGSAS